MSLKPTDLLYVNRGGTLYQVSWARIRERELLGSDELLVQREDDLYKVEIGQYWSGEKTIEDLDLFMVERGSNGILDVSDPGYKGALYQMSLSLPPFFAIDFISNDGAGGSIDVNFRLTAGAFNGDPEGPRIQKPDGSYIYLTRGINNIQLTEDGVYRFSAQITSIEWQSAKNCKTDASLTPGETWNLLITSGIIGDQLFIGHEEIVGVPEGLFVKSLNKTFLDSNLSPSVDLSSWDTSTAFATTSCFKNSNIASQDLSGWDVSNVKNMALMFQDANQFTGVGIDGWDCSQVTDMSRMFDGASLFNGSISSWTPTAVEDISYIFQGASSFDQPLNGWSMPALTKCEFAFAGAENFDSPVWTVLPDAVTSLESVFEGAEEFNQFIQWDTKNITTLSSTFKSASRFNQDLSGWDTSNVTVFEDTFSEANSFEGDLSGWDTSAGGTFSSMFQGADNFNSDLGEWETSIATNMYAMFSNAYVFNQDLSGWCVPLINSKPTYFDQNSAFQNDNGRQPQWGTCPDDAEGRFYLTSGTLKFKANKVIGSGKLVLRFPDGSTQETTSSFNRSLTMVGEYDLNMSSVRSISFQGSTDAVFDFHPDFYTGSVTDLSYAFNNCRLFNGDISNWNISNVNDLQHTFYDASIFEGDLSGWDTSKVTQMTGAFGKAMKVNNCNIENWNTSNVTNMNYTFEFNRDFNVDVSAWDVANVTTAESLFKNASSFNQDVSQMNWEKNQHFRSMFSNCQAFNVDISDWDTGTATSMDTMFNNCLVFDQDLSSWCVPLIKSKPSAFDNRTPVGFRTQPERQPQWGTCPARPLTDPKIESSDGSTISVDPSGQAVKDADATWADPATLSEQKWQGKVDSTSAWEEIATGGGDTTAVPPQFADGFIRLVQVFDVGTAYSNELAVATDSGLTTFAAFRFTNPGSPGDKIEIRGHIDSAGEIIYQDGTSTPIGPNFFSKRFSAEGVYAITTNGLTGLNFYNTNYDIEIDERSDLSDLRDASKMFETTKSVNDLDWLDTSQVTNMHRMFFNCHAYRVSPMDDNDVSGCTDMSEMFAGCDQMRIDCSNWDTGNVTNMAGMFTYAGISRSNLVPNSLDNFDVSKVTNMVAMLSLTKYSGNLNEWNTSNLEDCSGMFAGNKEYVGPLSKWDVSNVSNDMELMFYESVFNQDISTWCVSQFSYEPFKFARDCPLDDLYSFKPQWGTCPGNVDGGTITLTSGTLRVEGFCAGSGLITGPNGFSQTVSGKFDLGSGLTDAGDYNFPMDKITQLNFRDSNTAVFDFAPDFNTENVSKLSHCFDNCRLFNGDISNWDTSKVTNMYHMFDNASVFNGDISNWNVSKVVDMDYAFYNAKVFNQYIGGWDTSNLVKMSSTFYNAHAFNTGIGGWNTSNVTCMGTLFMNAWAFNQGLSQWDTTNVGSMQFMFHNANGFNQDISDWDTSNVKDMNYMFKNATVFNQDISDWCVPNISKLPTAFDTGSAFEGERSIQPNWGTCVPKEIQKPVIENSTTPGIVADYDDVLRVIEDGVTEPPFSPVNQWQREDSPGSGNYDDMPGETGETYTVVVDDQGRGIRLKQKFPGSGGTRTLRSNVITVTDVPPPDPVYIGFTFSTGSCRIETTNPNTGSELYKQSGGSWTKVFDFPAGTGIYTTTEAGFYVFNSADTTHFTFRGSSNDLDLQLDERSNTSNVTSLKQTFHDLFQFNQDLNWMDVSNVTTLEGTFSGAMKFNGKVSGWNTSKVTKLLNTFYACNMFNQSVDSWDVSNVVSMNSLFQKAAAFNQPLNSWNTSKVEKMANIFYEARVFDQDLSNWVTTNVTTMRFAFSFTVMTHDLNMWDVSNVTAIDSMFSSCYFFLHDLNDWDTSNLVTMTKAFKGNGNFNSNISNWNTSNVEDMSEAFTSCLSFNSDISGWDTSKVANMKLMFRNCREFVQDLSTWCVPLINTKPDHFDLDSNVAFENHPEVQPQWGTCPPRITSNPVIY